MNQIDKWVTIFLAGLFGLALGTMAIGVGATFIMDRVECIKYEDDKCYIPMYIMEIVLAVIGVATIIGICVLLMITVIEWSNK